MIDFASVKEMHVGQAEVVKVESDSTTLWQKPTTGRNLLNPSTVPDENKYIDRISGGTGNPSATGGEWRHSDYIPVTENTEYYFGQIHATASRAGMAWYDANKTYISGVNATTLKNADGVLTSPEGAAYMRHGWRIDEGYNTDWETTVYICIDGDLDHWVPYVGE